MAVQIERHGDRRVTESLADDLGGYALPHEFDGEDLRPTPLLERKAALRRLLRRAKAGIHFVDHVEGDGAKLFAHACELGLEGIVSKDRTRSYRSGRSKTWLKIKNPQAPGVTRFKDRNAQA